MFKQNMETLLKGSGALALTGATVGLSFADKVEVGLRIASLAAGIALTIITATSIIYRTWGRKARKEVDDSKNVN